METLLKKYYPVKIEDIEECSNGSIDAYRRGELSDDHMERLVRFVATHVQMRQHGMLSLLPSLKMPEMMDDGFFSMLSSNNTTTSALPEECKDIGLSEHEYNVLKGEYGTIMGISVKKIVYQTLIRKCKSKKALSMRDSETKSKLFIKQKMKALAATFLQKEQRKQLIASIHKLAGRNHHTRNKNNMVLFRANI